MKTFIGEYGIIIIAIILAGALLSIIYFLIGDNGLSKTNKNTNIYNELSSNELETIYGFTNVVSEASNNNIPQVYNGEENEFVIFEEGINLNPGTELAGKKTYSKNEFIDKIFENIDDSFYISTKNNNVNLSKIDIINKLKDETNKDMDLVITLYEAQTEMNIITGNQTVKMEQVIATDEYGVPIKTMIDGVEQNVMTNAVCYNVNTLSLKDTEKQWNDITINYTIPTRMVVKLRYIYNSMKVEYTFTVVNKIVSNRDLQ